MEPKVFINKMLPNNRQTHTFPGGFSCLHDGPGSNSEGNHRPDALLLSTGSQRLSPPWCKPGEAGLLQAPSTAEQRSSWATTGAVIRCTARQGCQKTPDLPHTGFTFALPDIPDLSKHHEAHHTLTGGL